MLRRVRLGLAWLFLAGGLCWMAYAFWRQDMQYSLPTPRPAGLVQPMAGVAIPLPVELAAHQDKPLLLHFFNPQCPCSRFNLPHVRELQARFPALQVVAVLESASKPEAIEATDMLYYMPTVWDSTGSIARLFGVYSTPQAVVLTPDGKLYYRGNYNRSRYCSDSTTAFAQQAIHTLLDSDSKPRSKPSSALAYGCPLPRDVRADTTWLDFVLN